MNMYRNLDFIKVHDIIFILMILNLKGLLYNPIVIIFSLI